MQYPLSKAICAGAVAGGIVLGLLGRAATAAVAAGMGRPIHLSARGLLEVAALGVIVGAIGGALLPMLRHRRHLPGPVPGFIVGTAVFVGSVFVAWLSRRIELTATGPLPMTLAAVSVVCLSYGVVASALLARFEHGGRRH